MDDGSWESVGLGAPARNAQPLTIDPKGANPSAAW